MTHEEVLDEVNVIYERISNYERYEDKNNLFSGRNYTEALEVLIDYYEVGVIEELEKIKAEAQKEENIWYHDCEADFSKKYDVIRIDTLFEIIDTRISELKGKQE